MPHWLMCEFCLLWPFSFFFSVNSLFFFCNVSLLEWILDLLSLGVCCPIFLFLGARGGDESSEPLHSAFSLFLPSSLSLPTHLKQRVGSSGNGGVLSLMLGQPTSKNKPSRYPSDSFFLMGIGLSRVILLFFVRSVCGFGFGFRLFHFLHSCLGASFIPGWMDGWIGWIHLAFILIFDF